MSLDRASAALAALAAVPFEDIDTAIAESHSLTRCGTADIFVVLDEPRLRSSVGTANEADASLAGGDIHGDVLWVVDSVKWSKVTAALSRLALTPVRLQTTTTARIGYHGTDVSDLAPGDRIVPPKDVSETTLGVFIDGSEPNQASYFFTASNPLAFANAMTWACFTAGRSGRGRPSVYLTEAEPGAAVNLDVNGEPHGARKVAGYQTVRAVVWQGPDQAWIDRLGRGEMWWEASAATSFEEPSSIGDTAAGVWMGV